MKSIVKALIMAASAAVLFSASMMGTAAYFTADVSSPNILFTVGQVRISLTTPYGGDQKIVPNTPNPIEPIVCVQEGSVNAYVRIFVTLNSIQTLDRLYGGDDGKLELTDLIDKLGEGWTYKGGECRIIGSDTRTYELRYENVAKAKDNIPAPFKSVTFPGNIVSTVSTDGEKTDVNALFETFEMIIEAEAIQAGSAQTADDAWKIYTNPN